MKQIGYQVLYDRRGYTLNAGNGNQTFPLKFQAENFKAYKENKPWSAWEKDEYYIKEVEYDAPEMEPCSYHNGKIVLNRDYYQTTSCMLPGDYIDGKVAEDLFNCLPPHTMHYGYFQLGEPHDARLDRAGICRNTYATFLKVAENVWQYCGNCFTNETEEFRG